MNVYMAKKSVGAALVVAGMSLSVFARAKNPQAFYCKYCGQKASSIAALTAAACIRHPTARTKANTNQRRDETKRNHRKHIS